MKRIKTKDDLSLFMRMEIERRRIYRRFKRKIKHIHHMFDVTL